MASRGNKAARSADQWLLNGSDRDESGDPEKRANKNPPSRDGKQGRRWGGAIEAEAAEWLVGPATEANGNGSKAAEAPVRAAERTAPAPEGSQRETEEALEEQRAENRDLAQRVRELQSELSAQAKAAEAEITEAVEERDSLAIRVKELESKPTDSDERVASKTVRRVTKKKGTPDLNSATFEQLRDRGLSVTQSARLIAYRDVRGGFESADELEEIPGLPKSTRQALREQLGIQA